MSFDDSIGIVFGTTTQSLPTQLPNNTSYDDFEILEDVSIGIIELTLTNLSFNTEYYYRVFVVSNDSVEYSAEQTITTNPDPERVIIKTFKNGVGQITEPGIRLRLTQ